MATDISGSVTPTYDAVITAPDDADAADAASISTLALGILNRVESIRAELGIANPWVSGGFLDDFDTAVLEPGTNADFVYGDTTWFFDTSTVVGDYDSIMNAVQPVPDPTFRGILNVQAAGASTCRIRKGFKTQWVTATDEITFRIMHDVVTSSGQSTEIGVMFETALTLRNTAGTEHALSLYFNPALNSNWQIRAVQAGAETLTVIPGSAPVSGTFQEIALIRSSPTQFTPYVDGVAGTPMTPAINLSEAGFQVKLGFGAASQGVQFDFIRNRSAHPGRVTP